MTRQAPPLLSSLNPTIPFDPAVLPRRPSSQPLPVANAPGEVSAQGIASAPATVLFSPEEIGAIEGAARAAGQERGSGTVHLVANEDVEAIDHVPPPPLGQSTVHLSAEELGRFRAAAGIRESAGRRATASTPRSATMILPPGAFPERPISSAPASTPPVAISQATATSASQGMHRARAMGIGALAVAALGLASFAGAHLLLIQSRSWIAPTVLSKSDTRVLEVAAALERETTRKSDLSLREKQILARLQEIEHGLSLEAGFRASFEAALRSDLAGQRAEVGRLQKLVADRMAEDDGADAEAGSPSKELTTKLESARRRIRMLESALPSGRPASTYGALALRREYDRSRLETEKVIAEKTALAKTLTEVEEALAKNQSLLASIESSPYRIAIGNDATLGFFPYENAESVRAGAPLMVCRAGTMVCTRVGTLGETLAGEAGGTNPVTGKPARGQLVRVTLTSPGAATRPLLFTGRTP